VEAVRQPHQIIHRPIITEKGTELKDQVNQYLFEVARDANKIEIKRAVESLFRVKVLQVRTLSMKGKKKRVGRSVGRTPDWKKAVATLKEGDSIEFFEGV
jgi:large subunit ribosomal protein L23